MRDSYIDFSNCWDYSASDFREIIDNIEELIIGLLTVIPEKDSDTVTLKKIGDVLYNLRSTKSLARDKRDEEGEP